VQGGNSRSGVRDVKQGEVIVIKTRPTPPKSTPMFEVVDQYDSFFRLGLTDQEKSNLIEHLLGPLPPRSNLAHEPQRENINPRGLDDDAFREYWSNEV
jgi:hypothetical protein